jgi:hypothetical protein
LPITTKRGYGYPGVNDAPDGPFSFQTLAEGVDFDVARLYGDEWVGLTLTGGWSAYIGGGNYYSGLRARIAGDDIQITGTIKSGALGSIIATLPALPTNLRPAYTAQAFVNTGAGTGTLHINAATGEISYLAGPAAPSYLTVNVRIPRS